MSARIGERTCGSDTMSEVSPEPPTPDAASPLTEERTTTREHQGHRSSERSLFDPRPYDAPATAIDKNDMDAHQEFHDPIHGFVRYKKREVAIIDHPAFQRLFKIYQLGQTHLVFRGATHSRGQHSLGTVAATQLLIEATEQAYERREYAQEQTTDQQLRWRLDRPLNDTEQAFARLAALLHDIGHIVDGHTIEDELGLLHDHASRRRLELVLDKTNWIDHLDPGDGSTSDLVTDSLRQLIDTLYAELARSAIVWVKEPNADTPRVDQDTDDGNLRQLKTASEILVEIIVRDDDRSELDMNRDISEGTVFRVPVLRDLVGNTVCADLIDYLQRDWRHIGRPRYLDTRLLQYMEIVTDSTESKLVVNLRSQHDRRPRPDVMSAILELLESRYHLWEVALLHRAKTCASAMLERAILERARDAGIIGALHKSIARLDDRDRQAAEVEDEIFLDVENALLQAILEASDPEACGALSRGLWPRDMSATLLDGDKDESPDSEEDDSSHRLFRQLDQRDLHKEIAVVEYGWYSQRVSDLLSPFKASRIERFEAACRRLSSLRKLEVDFELESGSLVLYCLPFGLGKKLADVTIAYEDEVGKLKDLDGRLQVSGGHLEAQLNRYDRLWRASLFASKPARDALKAKGLLNAIATTFRRAVLGVPDVDLTMHDLAKILSIERSEITYARGATLLEDVAMAERGNDSRHHYATGQPTIRSHFLSDMSRMTET